jgi:hypothetical protein
MSAFRLGATGQEVKQIQARLAELGFYRGPLDADFGGGTEAAVVAFQRARQLSTDGVVGDGTWRALFTGNPPVAPEFHGQPLNYRALVLEATIETDLPAPDCFSALVGDFDGQGFSFGALQFAFVAGSFGDLVHLVDDAHPGLVDDLFHANAAPLRAAITGGHDQRLRWAQSIQAPANCVLFEPWRGLIRSFGRTPECQAAQLKWAEGRWLKALGLCREYGLWSERGAALMFDIVIQNGSIGPDVKQQILGDVERLPRTLSRADSEVERMKIVGRRRAEASAARWVPQVLARKLTIATGRGTIHGRAFDLEADYGLRLVDYAA